MPYDPRSVGHQVELDPTDARPGRGRQADRMTRYLSLMAAVIIYAALVALSRYLG